MRVARAAEARSKVISSEYLKEMCMCVGKCLHTQLSMVVKNKVSSGVKLYFFNW